MNATADKLCRGRIIAIVRGVPADRICDLAHALHEGGVNAIEVTFDQSRPESWADTARAIRLIGDEFHGEVMPGAGTVLTVEQADIARDAGALYIISPDVNVDVISHTKKLGLASLPGALTPTEAVRAFNAGCDIVKIFPAGDMGAGYIKSICAPLKHIPFFAVGGVNASNAADFMRAGAKGLGVGGSLTRPELVMNGRFDEIRATAAAISGAVKGL